MTGVICQALEEQHADSKSYEICREPSGQGRIQVKYRFSMILDEWS